MRTHCVTLLLLALAAALAFACGDPDDLRSASTSVTAEATAAGESATPATAFTPGTTTPAAESTATSTPAPITQTPSKVYPTFAPSPTPGPLPQMPVMLDFAALPSSPWSNPYDSGSLNVSSGILTIDAPGGYNEIALYDRPDPASRSPWHTHASNERGWWVETRMRVDPLTEDVCASSARSPALTVWMTDDTHRLVRLGFSPTALCLIISHDTAITVPMNTTDNFHVYRVSMHRDHAAVSVDGAVVIEHDFGPLREEAEKAIIFGDGQAVSGPTRSYWDYVTYDVSGP